jgi:hypothetical protein
VNVEFFAQVAKRAAVQLDRALDCFYPVEGNNDVPEALTATYLAFQLRDSGYFVYPQAQCSGLVSNHIDFAAIDPVGCTVLLVEAKKLYSSEKAQSLGQDWQRLQTASITSEFRQVPHGCRYFACLLATTWDESYRDWWAGPSRPDAPGRQSGTAWADLKHALDGADLNLAVPVPLLRLGWSERLHVLCSFIPIAGPSVAGG